MELIVRVFGICIAFVPFVYLASYIIKRAKEEQKFDLHLNRVRDKKGTIGVIIAYTNRISLFILITFLGVYISSYFINSIALDVCIVMLIAFVFSYYLDSNIK